MKTKKYWACINPFMNDEVVAIFNDKILADHYAAGLATLKVIQYPYPLNGGDDQIADLKSRSHAFGKEVAKTLTDHFAEISKQVTYLIDRYGDK